MCVCVCVGGGFRFVGAREQACACARIGFLIQYATRMRRIVICGLSRLHNIFRHCLVNGTLFGKKVTEYKMCFLSKFYLKYFSFKDEISEI